MDNLKTLQEYLETTISENNNNSIINSKVLSETSNNNMTAVGGGVLSETSDNNMTAVGGGVLSETSNNSTTPEETKGGFFNSLFVKNNNSKTDDLLKLLETTQTSNVSPANINTTTMDNQVAKLLGGNLNVTESLTTEAMEQQLKELLGGKKN